MGNAAAVVDNLGMHSCTVADHEGIPCIHRMEADVWEDKRNLKIRE